MITEYCCFGDLLNFLRRKRDSCICFKLEEDYYNRNIMQRRVTDGSGSFLSSKSALLCEGKTVPVFTIQNVRRRKLFGQQHAYVWQHSAETRLLLSSSQRQLEQLHDHEAFCYWQPTGQLVRREEKFTTQRRASHSSHFPCHLSRVKTVESAREKKKIIVIFVYPRRRSVRRIGRRERDVRRRRSVSGHRRSPQLLVPSCQRHGVLSLEECEHPFKCRCLFFSLHSS